MSVPAFKSVAFASVALFALFHSANADAQPKMETATLEVMVTGLQADTGTVWIGVYASQEDWQNQREHAAGQVEVIDGRASARFEDVQSGTLGVQVFHDANDNGDFDKNMLGMPRERYGFSNNPFPRMRGANWDEAVFSLEPGQTGTVTIELQGALG